MADDNELNKISNERFKFSSGISLTPKGANTKLPITSVEIKIRRGLKVPANHRFVTRKNP